VSDIDEKSLMVAWAELEQKLIEANKHYLMHADGGRAAVFRQVVAINEFISCVAPGRPLLHMPLLALHLALHYLDHGIVEPMLAPNKSGRGRRPQQQAIRIRSAVAMSQLQDIGYERSEAAKRVAQELDGLGFKATPRAVADWRDRLKSGPTTDESAQTYRSMLDTETAFIGRMQNAGDIHDQKPKLRDRILETLTKFVLLAHLTSSPNLFKVARKLKLGSVHQGVDSKTFGFQKNVSSGR
jgi:hypothetical protein